MIRLAFLLNILLGILMADTANTTNTEKNIKNSLPDYHTKTLKNGLEIVAIPLHNNSDVISVDVYYKVGSRNEVMGKSGIAHMLEHMNFKSTSKLRAGEFDEIVKGVGGVNNASTGFDFTHYFIKSSSSNLDTDLSLFAELMANLNLKDEEFQTERDVVAEERRWRTDNNPMGLLYFKLFNTMYDYHPYHWTPIGFMGDIQTWSIEDIKQFHSTYYQPKNAIVIVSGDIDETNVFEVASKHFGIIENKIDKIPQVHTKEPKQMGAKRLEIEKENGTQIIAIAYHIPNFAHQDQIALSVISGILSDGGSSRLVSELVDKKKLVNSVYAYNMENTDDGVFLFMAMCNVGIEAKDVEKEILAQINRLKDELITEEELDKIKVNTKADFIYSMESSSNVSSLFGSYLARGDISPLLEYEDRLKELTTKQIQEVANKYFTKNNSTTVILKSPKKIEEKIEEKKENTENKEEGK